MERFVYNLAIVLAVLFAIGVGLSGGHFSFVVGDAFGVDPVVQASPQRVAAQIYQAHGVDIDHAAARIVVTPEDRRDISIEIDNPGRAPTPVISLVNGQVRIDGRLRGRVDDCGPDGVRLRGYGDLTYDQLPQVTIHAPRAVELSVGGGNSTQIGAAASVDADLSGCGATTVADVSGPLRLDVSGSGRVTAGAAQHAEIDVSGSGAVRAGAIAQDADLDISGSGGVELGAVSGALKGDVSGSGGITVAGGALTSADIDVSGSSATQIHAPVGHLSVDVSGSGTVSVEGGPTSEADLDVGGSGRVRLSGPVQHLTASLAGSGSVVVDGEVHDLNAEIAGSGTVRAAAVTGALQKRIMGTGDVIVGR